jgi:acetyl-CoA synthetase
VVGIPDDVAGSALLCACVAIGSPGPDMHARLSDALARDFGAPYRPKRIVFVSDLPRTRNQKIMRRIVRSLATQQPAGDLTSLSNPGVIDELRVALVTQPAAAQQ